MPKIISLMGLSLPLVTQVTGQQEMPSVFDFELLRSDRSNLPTWSTLVSPGSIDQGVCRCQTIVRNAELSDGIGTRSLCASMGQLGVAAVIRLAGRSLHLGALQALLVVVFSCIACQAALAEVDFEKHVVPLLESHCVDSRVPDDQNGGLNLKDPQTMFAEAYSGARAVVPGDPEESELLRRVTSKDEDLRMPPDGSPLQAEEIQLLEQWVASGASMQQAEPAASSAGPKSDHWAFQAIRNPELPEVNNPAWARNPIDLFIRVQHEQKRLPVAQDASPTELIRRATYDLTGLPPTPQEVNQFQDEVRRDGVEVAMSRLVDDLLQRTEYGERWGRHWMDWVRYADTAGDNSDFPIPQAYLYRQYIIDAFNADLPYDRFLKEQLAGDLLPAENEEQRQRQLIATGYLAMARRFGSLVERYPWHLTIEDTIDNMGRTMLGLTLACARCHDHKFDPISARDYYGLYGFFASTQYPFPGIELFQTQHHMVPLLPESEVRQRLGETAKKTRELEQNLQKILRECEEQAIENAAVESQVSVDQQRKMREELDSMLLRARRAGKKLADHLKESPSVPSAYAVQDGVPQEAPIHIKGEPTRPGARVPRKFPDVLGGYQLEAAQAAEGSGRLQLAEWIASPDNPLTARVIVNRVWQRHFGEGLVASSSDFGLRGERPTHPALLDWLATELIRNEWSIKHLHSIIMNSHTYRLSSRGPEENLSVDPENHWYWKFNRQRLDAEQIRDTLLFLSGELDTTPQREPYPIPPTSEWKYTQHHPFKDDYPTKKRSVYRMTKRLTTKTYFQTFDGPDPNVCTSRRDQSVTPLQALYFVNDEFLHHQADLLARRMLGNCRGTGAALNTDDRTELASTIFQRILCRQPSPEELNLMLEHLDLVRSRLQAEEKGADGEYESEASQEQQVTAWSSLVRSLLRLNEFVYVE